MRKYLLSGTAVLALCGTMAQAGGLTEPVMEPEIIAAETSSSGAGLIVPLIALTMFVAAIASSSNGGGTSSASDARLKTDIEWVGMSEGFALYQFRYKGAPARYEGVMAQDVLRMRPDAVVYRADGMMAVNYGKIGMKMRRVH